VATKYLNLTRTFFAAHGISDYRIVESLGATEGAPAAGLAEAIVDITTTGSTLAANDLKVLDDGIVLKSQAQLAASLTIKWSRRALEVAERFTARIAARELARGSYVVRVGLARSSNTILASLAKQAACTVISRDGGETSILCPRERLSDAIGLLRAKGLENAVAVEAADYVFAEANPPMQRLTAALKR
jgi:ATP phosphoribosyltransferase